MHLLRRFSDAIRGTRMHQFVLKFNWNRSRANDRQIINWATKRVISAVHVIKWRVVNWTCDCCSEWKIINQKKFSRRILQNNFARCFWFFFFPSFVKNWKSRMQCVVSKNDDIQIYPWLNCFRYEIIYLRCVVFFVHYRLFGCWKSSQPSNSRFRDVCVFVCVWSKSRIQQSVACVQFFFSSSVKRFRQMAGEKKKT